MRTKLVGLATMAAVVMTLSGSTAHAQLTGKTVDLQGLFPDKVTVETNFPSATVGDGIEFPDTEGQGITFDVGAHSLTITNLIGFSTFPDAPFNGFRLFDPTDNIDPFATATIVSGTTFNGFTQSRVTVSANSIFVDFAGLTPDEGQQVVLDITLSSAPSTVPEPSSMALLATGLVGLAPVVRRRRRS